jgi:hypothetical protein
MIGLAHPPAPGGFGVEKVAGLAMTTGISAVAGKRVRGSGTGKTGVGQDEPGHGQREKGGEDQAAAFHGLAPCPKNVAAASLQQPCVEMLVEMSFSF